MSKRDRPPDVTTECKGRFTIVTEVIPGNDPKRGRTDQQEQEASSSAPQQPPQLQLQLPPSRSDQPQQQPPPPQPQPQQQQETPQVAQEPQQRGGGVEQQDAADPDRPPPEPPPPEHRNGDDPPRTGGGAERKRVERDRHQERENRMRNRHARLPNLFFLHQEDGLGAALAVQEITVVGSFLFQELTTVDDMSMNLSTGLP